MAKDREEQTGEHTTHAAHAGHTGRRPKSEADGAEKWPPDDARKASPPNAQNPNEEGNATSNSAGSGAFPEHVLAEHRQTPVAEEGGDKLVIPAMVRKEEEKHPLRDDNGNLTRAGMERLIEMGESFTHEGVVVSSMATIPSEEELKKTNERRAKGARAAIDAQIAKLQEQRARA